MTLRRMILYFAILIGALISTTTRARPQETEVIAGGELEYQNHCAICHGVDGKGRGIMAKFLTISPSDLLRSQRKMPADFRFGRSIASLMGGRKSAAMAHAKCRSGGLDFRPTPEAAIPARGHKFQGGY